MLCYMPVPYWRCSVPLQRSAWQRHLNKYIFNNNNNNKIWTCTQAALPQCTVEPLHCVQNAAISLIFNLGRREHKTSCLIQLHWSPVRYRIQYKLCTLMHNIRPGRAPRYLSDIVQPTSARTTCSGLCSSSAETTSYVTPRLHTTFEEWPFSFSGAEIWKPSCRLTLHLRQCWFLKIILKHFFQLAFNIH